MKFVRIGIIIGILCLGFGMITYAQEAEVYPLWPKGPKESNGIVAQETSSGGLLANISKAELHVFHPLPEKNNGMAVVICPGGGYSFLAWEHEGEQFARWLTERGITGIVLKYRLPNKHSKIPLTDAIRAIRFVRSRAEEWNLNPEKIGIAGFSAGGHLAALAGTRFQKGNPSAQDRFERYSSRPDFMILFYPVISMSAALTHAGSREALLGKNPSQEAVNLYSAELLVSKHTPPAFLLHCNDDRTVSPLNSVVFYQALKRNHVPAALHIFDQGQHGWGMRKNFEYFPQWTALLSKWLDKLK